MENKPAEYSLPNLLKKENCYVYIGPSMNPTLKAPDILEVTPYKGQPIKVGDVLTFPHPDGSKNITHRAIYVGPDGVRTRGDNNGNTDPWLLKPENITGRVDWALRGKWKRFIHGGLEGRLFEAYVRSKRFIRRKITLLVRPIYRFFVKKPLLKQWFSAKLKPKIINYQRKDYFERQLVIGKYVIGRRFPGRRWRINPLFKLLIDTGQLN
ncbi:hypothetical protein A2291_08605 [candidate division WOR-1 bacterium RIFOXYB2_FULL_42_35]|uniref:Signal peptidase I n=1 Tax=candidate division WOR-1 bacterium RIFOXYC2_FULL_41_25 TaxID=1802586 RepID=A0A1F4TMA8_UNCSA|nr:MAG: hypothetical protein A2291_08605 [candidate division WOR-1 bacterium RIFOXYB2_FULL_42_35]OGC23068.1 MAG: hypothetical protein A2247_08505 [candidate division WOR-1 bacterium RIFOXYA2_FULL_41_14]OGC33640.1 MAG: hypothetical protein A2462_02195 [candidate division WOR-1 bacterium RIFOXYC2_FULL_41_25]OGC43603.1 MAG: hypothetical protein A2548_02285 [candidate division WOR-1 bacterium RIFOXYD2_FULL_41_8]